MYVINLQRCTEEIPYIYLKNNDFLNIAFLGSTLLIKYYFLDTKLQWKKRNHYKNERNRLKTRVIISLFFFICTYTCILPNYNALQRRIQQFGKGGGSN